MKLLLDENLSHRLVPALQVAYPGSTQVALEGLGGADDRSVWRPKAAQAAVKSRSHTGVALKAVQVR